MNISEVVNGYEKGKDIADKAMSPSRWFDNTKIKQDYQKGHAAAGKVLDPKQWFNKSSSGPAPAQAVERPINPKEALIRAANGQVLYRDHILALKSLHDMIKNKEIKIKTDFKQTSTAVELAYKQKPLDVQQKNILLQLSKKF